MRLIFGCICLEFRKDKGLVRIDVLILSEETVGMRLLECLKEVKDLGWM